MQGAPQQQQGTKCILLGNCIAKLRVHIHTHTRGGTPIHSHCQTDSLELYVCIYTISIPYSYGECLPLREMQFDRWRPVFMFLGIYSGFSQNVFFFFFLCFILLFYAFSFVLNCIFCCADPALLLLHFSNKCIISTSSPSSWPKNLHQMWC